ncbi:MAG: PhnD/SsuA/transferrin family substrate-binding protein [Campylobacterota bacterium]|nr:PhnD/SsuA/transferrin family substrate-binding protein [Campylobacterota bacterium]
MKYLILLIISISLMAERVVINFAPLPMVKSEIILKEYDPVLNYLEKETGYIFNLVYYADYATLLQKVQDGSVDIAFLGPLPYVELKKTAPKVQPIIRFLNAKGEDRYSCTLFTSLYNDITLLDLHNKTVALTQKLSTCGYLSMENILQKNGLSLKSNRYEYTGSHSNSILSVIIGDSLAGGAKTSIVEEYTHIGLKPLIQTEKLPGFLWVASEQLSKTVIARIKEAMLKLKPLTVPKDAIITKNWGKNIRYGAINSSDADYNIIRDMLKHIDIPK